MGPASPKVTPSRTTRPVTPTRPMTPSQTPRPVTPPPLELESSRRSKIKKRRPVSSKKRQPDVYGCKVIGVGPSKKVGVFKLENRVTGDLCNILFYDYHNQSFRQQLQKVNENKLIRRGHKDFDIIHDFFNEDYRSLNDYTLMAAQLKNDGARRLLSSDSELNPSQRLRGAGSGRIPTTLRQFMIEISESEKRQARRRR